MSCGAGWLSWGMPHWGNPGEMTEAEVGVGWACPELCCTQATWQDSWS